jgi:hypothetical protein
MLKTWLPLNKIHKLLLYQLLYEQLVKSPTRPEDSSKGPGIGMPLKLLVKWLERRRPNQRAKLQTLCSKKKLKKCSREQSPSLRQVEMFMDTSPIITEQHHIKLDTILTVFNVTLMIILHLCMDFPTGSNLSPTTQNPTILFMKFIIIQSLIIPNTTQSLIIQNLNTMPHQAHMLTMPTKFTKL